MYIANFRLSVEFGFSTYTYMVYNQVRNDYCCKVRSYTAKYTTYIGTTFT